MIEIIDIGVIKAERYKKKRKRVKELVRMIHACEVTYKSLLDIECPIRFELTRMMSKYRAILQKELDKLEKEK